MGSKILAVFKNPSFRLTLLLYAISILFLIIGAFSYKANNYRFFSQNLRNGKSVVIKINDDVVKLGTVYFKNAKGSVKKIEVDSKKSESQQKDASMYRAKPLDEDKVNLPKVGIILGELGLNKTLTLEAFNFENNIALGFSPYANDVSAWIDQAAARGFESYIQIPMQPGNYPIDDPGPHALLHNLSTGENLDNLDWILSKSNKLVGGYSLEDETFTNSKANVLPVFELLQKKQLSFLYGGKANLQSMEKISLNMEFDFVGIDVNLDESLSELEIKAGLFKLENLAKTQGFAVGKIRPYPLSIHVLKEWLNGLNRKEIVVVPVSNLFEFKAQAVANGQTSAVNILTQNTKEANKESPLEKNLNKDKSLSNQIKMIDLTPDKAMTEEEYTDGFSKEIKNAAEEEGEHQEGSDSIPSEGAAHGSDKEEEKAEHH